MPFDLAYLDQRVVDRLGLSSSDTRLTSTVRYRAINDALKQVCLDHDWPWLRTSGTITTVANTATAALPTGHIRTESLVDTTTGEALRRTPSLEIDELITPGRPSLYYVADVITFGPTPDGAYTLRHRYFRVEPELVNTTDVPLIPEMFARGPIEFAAALLLRQIRERERAAEAEADYRAWLKRARDNANKSREPRRIRVRPGAWF